METKNKVQKTRTAGKHKVVDINITQPQLQESDKERLHKFIQQEFIAQSGTLSIVTRTIAGVILGTIWAICYKERVLNIPNDWLKFSIVCAIMFFLVELLHYTVDSYFYHKRSDIIAKEQDKADFAKIHKEVQKHSKCSFHFLMIKALVTFVLSILFVIGIICLYHEPNVEKRDNKLESAQIETKTPNMKQKHITHTLRLR